MPGNGRFPGVWDWTDFAADNPDVMAAVRKLTVSDLPEMQRPGFRIRMFQTREQLFTEMALGYLTAWARSTADNPVGVCGPIGPVEHLPLVATIANQLGLDVSNGHFFAMDEFLKDDSTDFDPMHPLSFENYNRMAWYDNLDPAIRMPEFNLHFPSGTTIKEYHAAWMNPKMTIECTYGGQGNTKHIAFVDPRFKKGKFAKRPPTAEELAGIPAGKVELAPATIIQDARHSTNGDESMIPRFAVSVGLQEIIARSQRVVITHPGWHDNPNGYFLTTYMLHKGIADGRVPMSCLNMHGNVEFWFLEPNLQDPGIDVH